MKQVFRIVLVAMALTAFSHTASAEDANTSPTNQASQPAPTGDSIKRDAKAAGQEVGQGARDVGHATKDAAVTVGHGARDAGREVGHAARDGWTATKCFFKGMFNKSCD
jgi:hypothetical protein